METRISRVLAFGSLALRLAVLLVVVAAVAAFLKLHVFGTTVSSDYLEYIQTAEAFAGDSGEEPSPNRILKPLAPALVALLSPVFGFDDAMLFQALVFYLAFSFVMFLLAREFLEDDRLAFCTALMATLSYPMLKYGIDVLIETGAIFFYALSLLFTVRFLKRPHVGELLVNVLVVSLGFLWKEYSVVSGAVLGMAILFHPSLATRAKALMVSLYVGIFLAIHVPWQWYVYEMHGFTYLTWYGQNAGPGFATEFTLKNIVKSTAAVIGLAWLLVPFAVKQYSHLSRAQRRFLTFAAPPPFIGYAWGYISSRLLFVLAPPFLLVAGVAMKTWRPSVRYLVTAAVVAGNLAWLVLSYSIAL